MVVRETISCRVAAAFQDGLQGGSERDWFFADLDGLDLDDDDLKKDANEELELL